MTTVIMLMSILNKVKSFDLRLFAFICGKFINIHKKSPALVDNQCGAFIEA